MKMNESKEELRERILVATRTSFAHGVAPSLAEVAQVAGVSRTTLYRAFASREELLQALAFEPEVESRERLLAQAIEMIGQHGLAALSMDALADAAGVSRATVYRLFPGKAALFREVVKTYAPFERLALLVEQLADRSPEEVMPKVAQVLVELFRTRAGLYRTLMLEISGQREDTEDAAMFILARGIGPLLGYLQHQMQAGCLRQIAPFIALQAFVGPLVFHLMTRPVTEGVLGLTISMDEVVAQFVAFWLRAMKSEDPVAPNRED